MKNKQIVVDIIAKQARPKFFNCHVARGAPTCSSLTSSPKGNK